MKAPHPNFITFRFRHALLALVPAVLVACGGGGGNTVVADNGDAPSTAARSTPLPAGDADCPNGGILVETGIDENKNGVLDDSEVDNSNKLCNGLDGANGSNGADGTNALVSMTLEPAGANCPYKGIRIDSGQDANNNGVLDPAEISDTRYVCNLIDGQIGWQVAELIEAGSGDAYVPQIAFDANGNALAVWRQYDFSISRNRIWAKRYTPGSGWGVAEPIDNGTGDAYDPQIAIDANGNALAVWRQYDGSRYNIWANRYTAGTGVGSGWGAASTIESGTGDAGNPQIAIDADGNALAVWRQKVGTRDNIRANRYTAAGDIWGTDEPIETGSGNAFTPQIAIDANGNAMAVWQQYDSVSGNYRIWANRYTAGTGVGSGWDAAGTIDNGSGDAYDPQVAFDANGNALAVWRQYDGSRYNIWANRYTAGTGVGSGWGAASTVESGTGEAYDPQIAIDANGNALAVWSQSDGTRYNIWANRYTAGTGVGSGWGTAELIETDNAGNAFRPQIALDTNGNALAVWRQFDGTRDNIWANRYTAGTGWGYAELIETDNAGNAFAPQIAIDANGNALAVWRQYDGTRDNIWANRWIAP